MRLPNVGFAHAGLPGTGIARRGDGHGVEFGAQWRFGSGGSLEWSGPAGRLRCR